MPDNSQYAYIVGRLRALETKMLTPGFVERLLDSPDAHEAFRVLADMPLIASSIGSYEVQDFSKVLLSALREMKALIIQMAPYPEHMDFLWLKYDFHNLKVVLKAQLTGRGYADVEHALIDLGKIPMTEWEKYILEGVRIDLTPALDKTIADVKAVYEKTSDPQMIDMGVDQHYLDALRQITDSMESLMISSYLSRLIDFSNLKTVVRMKELKRDSDTLSTLLLSGGHVDLDAFTDSFERGYDEIRQVLEKRMHADDLVVALTDFIEIKSLTAFEKKAYETQQRFMSDSLKISFGPEPVFAFFLQFEIELHILRTILIGKLNKLPLSDINHAVLSL